MLNKKYCVVGIGYIGLPCAIMLANVNCVVLGYDSNPEIVKDVKQNTIDIEPELKKLLASESVRNNLRVSTAIEESDVFIIAVPTPINHQKKTAELSALLDAVKSVASVVKTGDLIIVESTIPPLTMDNLVAPIFKEKGLNAGEDIFLAHCPERLLPGNIVNEIINNNRIIGGINRMSAEMAAQVYRLFVKGAISLTDSTTAEMCKLMENTYRDINIALANELSEVCGDIGIDIVEAIDLANMHPRVNLLKPGIGVGGHCLPIDPWFIHEVSPYNSTMIMAARHINDGRPAKIAAKIRRELSSNPTQPVLLLGKTYKAETNDIRESPSLKIFNLLAEDGYNVYAFDSEVDDIETLAGLVQKCSYVFVLVPHKFMIKKFSDIIEKIAEKRDVLPKIIYY